MSFPLRERGLKRCIVRPGAGPDSVVPLAGTWIETQRSHVPAARYRVVPLAGTWIETRRKKWRMYPSPSFPLRERGLKLHQNAVIIQRLVVVPLAGTWIETAVPDVCTTSAMCRSPCGNVD